MFLHAKETAAGYEGVQELYRQYSVNSRMEAVYIRDEMLKLHTKTGSLRRPLEVVRFLEDEISKREKKLVRFPDLCLNAADKSAIPLQAVSVQAREYLVLHGKTGSWSEMSASLRFYEEQLRMVKLPGGGVRGLKGDKGRGKDDAPKDKSKVVCWYCGKAGHYQEDCRQKIADNKKRHPKGDSGKGKDKGDHGKTGREKPDPKGKRKGKDSKGKGKGKDKDKGKKDKRVRAVGEGSVDQEEPEGECLMALREGELIPTGVLRTTTPTPAEHQVQLVGVEQQDAYWLVDSGATSHCMWFSCFEKYDVLRTYDHKPTLSNASNETIEVLKVCDVRVRFGKQVVVLEHCLITNLDFNVLSPFVAWQRGWHTMLTNSPHIYNKKNKKRIRLTVKDRAWYAVATLKDGGDQMELDVVQQKPPAAAQAKSKPEKPEAKPKARSASQKPEISKPNKAQRAEEQRALESVKSLEYTPFKFLLRSLRTTRLKGSLCEDSETQGSRMKAVPDEVAQREHQEVAWLLAVLFLNMVGMLALRVRVARSVCACKVSGLSFPGGFPPRLQGVCDSVRGKVESECLCGFKPRVKGTVFRRSGSVWCLIVFLLLVPYGASGSESNGCSDHSSEGVLADYSTKAELSGYSAKGVGAEGGFRYGERLGNVALEATSVFSFSEKGSQWESYDGKGLCSYNQWGSYYGKSLSSDSQWESCSSCSSCFSKAGVLAPAAAQGEASQVGAVTRQLYSESERSNGESGRSEEEIGRDARNTESGDDPRAPEGDRRTRTAYASSLWNVGNASSRCEGQAPKFGYVSTGACCFGGCQGWVARFGQPHGVRLFVNHRVVALPGARSGDYRRNQPATGEPSQIETAARGPELYQYILWFRGRMGGRFRGACGVLSEKGAQDVRRGEPCRYLVGDWLGGRWRKQFPDGGPAGFSNGRICRPLVASNRFGGDTRCGGDTGNAAASQNGGTWCCWNCTSQGCHSFGQSFSSRGVGESSCQGIARKFSSGARARGAPGAAEVFGTDAKGCKAQAGSRTTTFGSCFFGGSKAKAQQESCSSRAGACSAKEEASSSPCCGLNWSDCEAGVYVATSTSSTSSYLPATENAAYAGATTAAEDADARNVSAGHADARNVSTGHAAASNDAAGDAASRNGSAGHNASRYGATGHEAATDGHDDAYVSYYARFFTTTASGWTVPLLPTSFVRKCDRKGKRLKIRRGWRCTKDLVRAGSCLYVVSRNRVSVMSLVGWQVVEVQGSRVRAESCAGERGSDAVHVLSCCRSACAHVCHVCEGYVSRMPRQQGFRSACAHVLSCDRHALSCGRSACAHVLSCGRSACAHVVSCGRSACAHVLSCGRSACMCCLVVE